MKVRIVGSTKPGYVLPKEEALIFGGHAAGMCYMPNDFDSILSEPEEKTVERVGGTLESGHHSVDDHPTYNFVFENIPKILAMVLNNEGMYTTSEKSARYTKMEPSLEELVLYNKWLEIFKNLITEEYGERYLKYFENEKKATTAIMKLAQENARYMISVFTNTSMEHTLSFRQTNYILHFFENFIEDAENTPFNIKLKISVKHTVQHIKAHLHSMHRHIDIEPCGIK